MRTMLYWLVKTSRTMVMVASLEWCQRDRGRRLEVVSERSRVRGDREDDGDGGWLRVVSERSRKETQCGIGEIEGEGKV
ncbi:hypothetical protein D8674_019108 [Pyrus ussuriensis x Pyrus communis]|uniref:Uncharacterized protein n=1 Tax=Pyrus ussuriensis x Pyrus communis TaxID=2448454 RepID=A0A5N5G6T7_9ROSA|nr:hypothetical protein D8674_019108 [Pyrus ussuriensis x Pyrus communis]